MIFPHLVQAVDVTQETLDYIGANLVIKYEVISNLVSEARTYSGKITLSNGGSETINNGSWEIHFCHIRLIPKQNDQVSGLKIQHINGCQFKMTPTSLFQPIPPNGKVEVDIEGEFWTVSKTDIMPNWYVVSNILTARTIASTAGENLDFVGDFNTRDKWKRYWFDGLKDLYDPFTAEQRFDRMDIENTEVRMSNLNKYTQMSLYIYISD